MKRTKQERLSHAKERRLARMRKRLRHHEARWYVRGLDTLLQEANESLWIPMSVLNPSGPQRSNAVSGVPGWAERVRNACENL